MGEGPVPSQHLGEASVGLVLGPGLGAWGTRGRRALGWGQRLVPGPICLEAQEREGEGQGRQGGGRSGGARVS